MHDEETVFSIPDDALLKRAVRSAVDPRERGAHTRRQGVMFCFLLGSTYAGQLCKRFGLDPDEMVKI